MEDGDAIASLIIEKYNALPKKGKPLVRSNGVPEWTILAGIVILNAGTEKLECVALATGAKAMPNDKLPDARGQILHDCHAEILAIRAFNRYVIDRGISHVEKVYLYVCTPPCGDASMSMLNGADDWTRAPAPAPGSMIRGRAYFNHIGYIRTKPGRADSVVTTSKSCSDKLCLRQTRGLLLSPTRRLFGDNTVFLDALVCSPVLPDFDRAFSRWNPTHRFAYVATSVKFADFHPSLGVAAPTSVIWTPDHHEVVANGVKQGSRRSPSFVSRAELLAAAKRADAAAFTGIERYNQLKTSNSWPPGWERTAMDDFIVA